MTTNHTTKIDRPNKHSQTEKLKNKQQKNKL